MKKNDRLLDFKGRWITLSILIVLIIGGITLRLFIDTSSAVTVTYIPHTINLISINNPVFKILNKEIIKFKEEKAKEEAKRILEEERIAKEIKIAEEQAKAEEAKKIEIEKAKNQKVAYLTFDDGPSEIITPLILDILQSYDIKATFFVLGKMAVENPDVLVKIYEGGHSIGHHSYSHNYNYIYKNTDNFLKEIKTTEKVFKDILGEEFETSLLRLPGGSFEKYKKKYVKMAEDIGYINYDWDALNGDAEGKDVINAGLVKRLKSTIKGRKEVIILMHDTDTKMGTVETLPEIIEYLIDLGYIFKPLEQ